MVTPNAQHLAWAVSVLRAETAADVRGLRDGGAPWLIDANRTSDGRTVRAVLRVTAAGPGEDAPPTAREHAGMNVAASAGIPVPQVLGEHVVDGSALLLIEYLPGSGAQPMRADAARLRTLGATAAAIFRATPSPAAAALLPAVEHPIPSVDFAALRAQADPQPLLVEAEGRVSETVADPVGFVHGDLWSGNTLWEVGDLRAVLDWDCAGIGAAGVDLGSLRCDAAMCFGGDAADEVLAGWESAAGRAADSVAYWDVVAALSTPPDIAWFAPAIAGMTERPDLTASMLRERRDAFLADALRRLG